MPHLQIQSGKHRGKRLRLSDAAIVIGRSETANLRIASSDISREHCRLRVDGETVYVEDLGSANGTFVNGEPTRGEVALPPGGSLHVGPMAFQLIDPNAAGGADGPKRRKSKVAASVLKKPKEPKAASEDDALAWLTEDVPNQAGTDEDTNIIAAKDLPPEVRQPVDDTPPASKASFDSVAEEAQDIFRRHRLMADKSS